MPSGDLPGRFAAFICCSLLTVLASSMATAGALHHDKLQRSLKELTDGFAGRVGVCAQDEAGRSCVNANEAFSLQSVMKLVVSLAALEADDNQKLHLDDPIVVRRKDLSLYVQPLSDVVGTEGYTTTGRDLIHRAIVDSDSAASDILVRQLGGPRQVQVFLQRKGLQGVRIDRDERHLQTEIVGLTWRPEYVDAATLEKAISAVSKKRRAIAYRQYQADLRDTSTPSGMASLLQELAAGRLLSPATTRYALDTMAETATFPDRLKAGVPPGWLCMHKTGTSGSWNGVTAATNDVGVLRAPDGKLLSIAVFIADTQTSPAVRSKLMQTLASQTAAAYY